MVVPTSRSLAPLRAMTSGIRKDPPISTSSPRETTTSFPRARVSRQRSTAAALLLTAMAASAPLISHRIPSMALYRSPRAPLTRSNSRLVYRREMRATFSTAGFGQEGPAQVGVHHDPGGVDHRPQGRHQLAVDVALEPGHDPVVGQVVQADGVLPVDDRLPESVHQGPADAGQEGPGDRIEERVGAGLLENTVDSREFS